MCNTHSGLYEKVDSNDVQGNFQITLASLPLTEPTYKEGDSFTLRNEDSLWFTKYTDLSLSLGQIDLYKYQENSIIASTGGNSIRIVLFQSQMVIEHWSRENNIPLKDYISLGTLIIVSDNGVPRFSTTYRNGDFVVWLPRQ